MDLKPRIVLTCLAVIGLAACASTPQQRYAGRIKAAQTAGRPLVVYGLSGAFESKPRRGTRVNSTKAISYWLKVGFINTAHEPIEKLIFRVGVENLASNKPVLGANGEPVQARLTAEGPFAPGSSNVVVGGRRAATWPVAAAALLAPGNSCMRLDGIDVVYPGGTKVVVRQQEVDAYLIPQMRTGIRCAYFQWSRGLPSVSYSPIWTPPPNG